METKENRITGGTVLAVFLCAAVGVLACIAGALQERFLGSVYLCAPLLALLGCMAARNQLPSLENEPFRKGASFCGRTVLEAAAGLFGGTLSLAVLQGLGFKALPLTIANVLLALAAARVAGKALGISENAAVMAGSSIGTCGYPAAAAFGRTVKARESEVAFVAVAVFVLDILLAGILPYVIRELGFTANQFAFIAGSSIGSMEAVENAQRAYGELVGNGALQSAAQVKTAGAVFLAAAIPGWVLFKNAQPQRKRRSSRRSSETQKLAMPWFLIPFIVLLALNTAGVFNETLRSVIEKLTELLFATGMAGIGFRVKLRSIFTRGMKPMAACAVVWVLSLALSFAFTQLFAGYVG